MRSDSNGSETQSNDHRGDAGEVSFAELTSSRTASDDGVDLNDGPFFMDLEADLAEDPANYCLSAEGRFPD